MFKQNSLVGEFFEVKALLDAKLLGALLGKPVEEILGLTMLAA
jgi:hypothetical protein